jgi:hypothetical protein
MKKLIFTLTIVVSALFANAQGFVWHENFDAPSLGDSVNSYTSNAATSPGWAINSRVQVSPTNCDSAFFAGGDTVILYTDVINFTGNSFVILDFDHICKNSFFDASKIEVSNDGGLSWTKLTCPNGNYLTPPSQLSNFCNQNSQFGTATYAAWIPLDTFAVADNSWWRHETFDISNIAGNSAQVIIRWIMYDDGLQNNFITNGWKIDNINITAAPCELNAPSVLQCNPILQGTVYYLGPYDMCLTATDQSGIASAWMYWTINGVPDSLQMVNTADSTFTAQIPAVNDSDTICYHFVVIDSSCASLTTVVPATGCIQFVAHAGITYPYCDGFDIQTDLWHDSSAVAGTIWELGTPAFGLTNSAHSPPNAWDVNLTTPYQPNADAILYSPVLGPMVGGSKLTLWNNYNSESSWDGARIEYSVNGTTWTVLGDAQTANTCGCEVNWYDLAIINSSGLPAWTGNSGGWGKSEFTFTNAFNGGNFGTQTQFRFIFTSDASVQLDGFSFDDICITLPQPEDAGVAVITQPGAQGPAGNCVPVIVTLQNFGLNPLTSFDVYYSVDSIGGFVTFGPFPWTGNLAPGDTVSFTLPCFTVPAGAFTLCSWTSFPTDGNHFNDTTCINSVGVPVFTLTKCDDLESGNIGYIPTSSGAGSDWQLGTPAWGQTTGAHSGINAWDINLTSPYTIGSNATLTTPIYNISVPPAINPSLSFWQNRNIDPDYDGMHVEYSVDQTNWFRLGNTVNPANSINWYNIASIDFSGLPGFSGNSGGGWIKSTYFFQDVLDANPTALFIQFRFVFESGFPFPVLDGISIDDICVTQPDPLDVGVSQINQPTAAGPAGVCLPIVVTLYNFGADTLTSFDVYYDDGSGPQGPFAWSGILLPGKTVLDTLPCDTIPAGAFTLCSWTSLVGDSDPSNDTNCINSIGIPVLQLTNCDDLESGNSGYVTTSTGTGTIWELGTPAYGQTTGAHSGVNAWDINLSSTYNTGTTASLTTPIYDLINPSPAVNPGFSFWQNRNIDPTYDGMHVEYTVDGGLTWFYLGAFGSANAINWYNTASINFSGFPGFSDNSGGWIKSTYFFQDVLNANPTAQYIQFRFVFASGFPFPTLDGISIDDICVTQPGPFDAGVTSFITPGGGSGSGQPCGAVDTVRIVFYNYGSQPITQTNISWALNGSQIATTTWSGSLAPGAFSPTITLDSSLTYPCGPFTLCAYTQLIADGDTTNDTICVDLIGIPVIPLSYNSTYCDDFEAANIGWTVQTGGAAGTNWQLGTPAFGTTTGAHSGTKAWDVNLASPYGANANTILYSPFFDFSQAVNTKLSFWVNYNTELNYDGVRLAYQKNGAGGWTLLNPPDSVFNWYNMPNIGCSNAPAWAGNSAVDLIPPVPPSGGWAMVVDSGLGFLNGPPPNRVQFRFIFCSDVTVQVDGFSIDDFCLEVPVPLTVSPVTIANSASGNPFIFPGQSITFNSNIKNTGTTPVTSAVACVYLDGNPVPLACDTVNFSPALLLNQFQNHVFTNSWISTPGVHSVCVITSYPNQGTDLKPADDTICTTISVIDTISVTTTSPYCPDFESGPLWTTLHAFNYGPVTSWQHGTPNQSPFTSAHSGTNAWMTNLNANYPNRDSSALFTPAFNLIANENYNLSFWHEYITEVYQDGGDVEYSTDFGVTWQELGTGGEPNNWYNAFFVTALGGTPPLPGWSGFLPAWQQASHNVCIPQSGPVMFRFRFASDYSVNDIGWVIDDFCLTDLGTTCPTGIEETNSAAGFALGQNHPNPTNGLTSVDYSIPEKGNVLFQIVNVIGQVIATPVNENEMSGKHTVSIEANKLSPGIYYYSLTFNNETITKKMVITK